jgi:hypothetical protein
VIAGGAFRLRKVRTPQSTMLDSVQAGRPDGKCNRKQGAGERAGSPASVPVSVKRWCKRPPAAQVTGPARQTPSGARPSRKARSQAREGLGSTGLLVLAFGLVARGGGQPPSQMDDHRCRTQVRRYRIRLIDPLRASNTRRPSAGQAGGRRHSPRQPTRIGVLKPRRQPWRPYPICNLKIADSGAFSLAKWEKVVYNGPQWLMG